MPQQVRKGEELDETILKAYLNQEGLIGNTDSEIHISQFSTGFSNLTYLLKIEEKEYVLRRPPFGAIKRGHDMGREFKVLSGLKSSFDKIPKAYCFSDGKDTLGAPFYIMERMHGIILDAKEAKKRNLGEVEFPSIANSWMDTFVELHQVDYKAAGLEDLGRPDGYVERQVTNWGKQYLKAATMDIPQAALVMKWMQENQPKHYKHSIIHNDYKYDNVVFKDENWTDINAVLDWEMCTLGDPLMDLGTSVAYWSMHTDSEFITKGWPSPTAIKGNPGREELVQMYASKSGQNIDDFVFYYVYGLFKIAVIVQQIYYRYANGLTKDERFAQLDKATQLFCLMATQAIQKKRIENLF